jgi:hypothetical protein
VDINRGDRPVKDNSSVGVQTSNSLATISAIARSRRRMVGRLRAVAAGRDARPAANSLKKEQNKTRHTFSACRVFVCSTQRADAMN